MCFISSNLFKFKPDLSVFLTKLAQEMQLFLSFRLWSRSRCERSNAALQELFNNRIQLSHIKPTSRFSDFSFLRGRAHDPQRTRRGAGRRGRRLSRKSFVPEGWLYPAARHQDQHTHTHTHTLDANLILLWPVNETVDIQHGSWFLYTYIIHVKAAWMPLTSQANVILLLLCHCEKHSRSEPFVPVPF